MAEINWIQEKEFGMPPLEKKGKRDAIRQTGMQSRMEFRSNQGTPEYLTSGREYLETLNGAVKELKDWENDVMNKTEMREIPGTSKISVPNRNDPYFKLHAETVPFIIEVRKERDELDAWLKIQ